ncbi:MAG TPA: nitroreductase family protein [Bacteroidales bacterium]|nr:nitroreductase family protein [Bacteroidales bacterium]
MKIKSLTAFIMAFLTGSFILYGQSGVSSSVTDVIMQSYSARVYTSEPVSDQDLDLILQCGIKAPSSRNGQPWKFTVVKDTALMKKAIGTISPGNVLILVSGPESQEGPGVDFDCALATENMNIAAQGLGLGARIYGGPIRNVNSTMKQILEIPEGYRVVTILRIGHIDKNVDAVSSASARKKYDEVVNYRK